MAKTFDEILAERRGKKEGATNTPSSTNSSYKRKTFGEILAERNGETQQKPSADLSDQLSQAVKNGVSPIRVASYVINEANNSERKSDGGTQPTTAEKTMQSPYKKGIASEPSGKYAFSAEDLSFGRNYSGLTSEEQNELLDVQSKLKNTDRRVADKNNEMDIYRDIVSSGDLSNLTVSERAYYGKYSNNFEQDFDANLAIMDENDDLRKREKELLSKQSLGDIANEIAGYESVSTAQDFQTKSNQGMSQVNEIISGLYADIEKKHNGGVRRSHGRVHATTPATLLPDDYDRKLYLTDDEKKVWAYYLATDEKKAEKYIESLDRALNYRRSLDHELKATEYYGDNKAAGVITSIASPIAKIGAAYETAKQNISNAITNDWLPVDIYSNSFSGVREDRAARAGITKDMSEGGSFVTNALLSAGQNLALLPVSAIPVVGKAAYSGIMGASAMGDAAYDATMRGASADEALAYGFGVGVIETVTERIGVDNLFKIANGGKKAFTEAFKEGVWQGVKTVGKTVVTSGMSEGTEEIVSQVASTTYDRMVMGDRSEYDSLVRKLEADGKTHQQAESQAFWELYIKGSAEAFAGGFISGGIFGGIAGSFSQSNTKGYGKHGADTFNSIVREYSDISSEEINANFKTAYEAGRLNTPVEKLELTNNIQRMAYNAGRMDCIVSKPSAVKSGYATVYGKEGGFVETDYSADVDQTTKDRLNTLGKALGIKIRFADKVKGGEANGEYSDGIITIARDAENPLWVVAKHEITHHLQKAAPKEYANYAKHALEVLSRRDGLSAVAFIENYKNTLGISSDEKAYDEIAADFTEAILTDEKALSDFVDEMSATKESRTIAQKFFDAIHDFIAKIKKAFGGNKAQMNNAAANQFGATVEQLEKAEQLWKEAFKKAEAYSKSNPDGVKTEAREAAYSFKGINKFGIEVYQTGTNVLKLSWKERKRLFLDKMIGEYSGRTAKFVKDGKSYYARFEEADVRKNIYGDDQSDANGRDAKINVGADGDIFNLVENAKHYGYSVEKGKNGEVHKRVDGWDYFVKTVQVDGRVFDLLANVRKRADGEYVYNIGLKESKTKKAAPPRIPQQAEGFTDGAQTASDKSIPHFGTDVKNLSMKGQSDLLKELVEKYGAIPTGEKPSREVQIPKKTSEDKKVSQTVRTILEAEVTPDGVLPTIEQLVTEGEFSYDVYTDKEAIADATAKKYPLNSYSEQQMENWKGSKQIVVYRSVEQLYQFIQDALDGKNLNKKMYFGSVSKELANRIREATGAEVERFNCTLRASEIRKILHDHGDEASESLNGQRAIITDDFLRIPDVIQSPDSISLSDRLYEGKPVILFVKEIGGKTTVVSYISKKHMDLTVQTMYAGKNKGSLATTPDEVSPDPHTSETLSGTASKIIVSQEQGDVKQSTINDNTRDADASDADQERWSADRIGDEDKKPMRVSELVEKIRHDFGINITTGHVRGSGVRGQYHRVNQGVRTRIANNLPTIAHELGHHLDNIYGLTKSAPEEVVSELENNLSDDMKGNYPKKKWATEGLAEFIRKYLQNHETAAIDYPSFTKYIMTQLNGKDAALLIQLADEVNAYYALDADTATSAIRLSEERNPDAQTIGEKIREWCDNVYRAWVDSNHGIKRFDDAIGANTYKFATNAAYADAIAGHVIVGDLTDANGQYVAPGLKTVLSGIDLKNKEQYRLFGEYLVVQHGPERLREGMRVFADDRKNSSSWMEQRAAELERQYPEFKKAAERLYKFQKVFLKTWGVDTGLISKDMATEWETRWQFYVPLNRAVGDVGRIGAKRGFANQNSTIKKAHGSGLDVVHPVDNVINNIVRMVNAGVRNSVMQKITDAAEKLGADATFLEKVDMPLAAKKVDVSSVKESLIEMLEYSGMDMDNKNRAISTVNRLDDILTQYSKGRASGDVIAVLKNGEQEFWKINDPLLLSSITTMAPKQMDGILDAIAVATRFMTANITGNNVLWSIFSNFPRDVVTLFTYSKTKNPVKVFRSMGEAYVNKAKADHADPLYKEYLAMGGGMTSAYTADRDLAKKARKKLRGTKFEPNPLEWLAFVSDAVEMGPRYATYKLMREKGMNPQEAFYESMDITVNFRRGGSLGREANKLIPFFNASVQGLDKFARYITGQDVSATERKKVVRGRATAWVAVNAALAMLVYAWNNRDDDAEEDYEQLSNYTKNSYWCFGIGNGKFFTIPKPRELAVLSSFFETCMEYGIGENDHAFDEFYGYVADNMLPSVISDLTQGDVAGAIGSLGVVGVGTYLVANRDFLGRPIVSAGLQELEAKDQYTDRTSKIAYWIGQAFDTSPQKIDYFFNGVLGGWWKYQKALFPVGKENVDLTLGIQGSYVKDNQYSTDLLNWLYEQADKSSKAKNSNPGNMEKAITAKMDDNMTTFYSRYYKLAKDKRETTASRGVRQTVLDMIKEYQKATDNDYVTDAQRLVYDVIKATGKTDNLPSVMTSTIKDGKGELHTLSDMQYVEYQTEYNRLYWEYAERYVGRAWGSNDAEKTTEAKSKALAEAKRTAKEEATNRALKRIGASTSKSNSSGFGGGFGSGFGS